MNKTLKMLALITATIGVATVIKHKKEQPAGTDYSLTIKKRLTESLIRFIEEATSSEASTSEIEALPGVANVLYKTIFVDLD